MTQYINKFVLVAEIEELRKNAWESFQKGNSTEDQYYLRDGVIRDILSFIDNLEVKEVDLEKELKILDNTLFDLDGVAVQGTTHYLTVEDVKDIAKHFFELGMQQSKNDNNNEEDEIEVCSNLMFTVKEKNFIWKNARTTVPEDSTNQIICIKEDGLAVSTVGKIVNGTIKWAYLDDLLNTNSFNVEVKEADLKKEIKRYIKDHIHSYCVPGVEETARHFFELGLKAQKRE